MSAIRPLEPADLDRVCRLYERVMRSGAGSPPPGLAGYFERTLVRQPWAEPDLPSLVFADGEEILGFIGAHVRRLRFDGVPIRLVCAGQLIADPDGRKRGVGALLLRDILKGPQEVTITDGGTPTVGEMWERLSGGSASLRSIAWTRVFRPARAAGDRVLDRIGREGWRPAARRVLAPLDAAAASRLRPAVPEGVEGAEELSPGVLLEHLPEVTKGARLHVDYDEPYLGWLFSEMAAVTSRGPLVKRVVRRRGSVAGWYVAYLPPGGVGQTMQIAGGPRVVEAVIDRLFADAAEAGVAALQGRLEPALFEPLARKRCLLRYGERALLHTREPEVRMAVERGEALLTRMDGEWWMGHHTEELLGPAPVSAG